MDHMKEGDEPRFTTSALTAPTSRETSRTFAPRRHYLPRGSYLKKIKEKKKKKKEVSGSRPVCTSLQTQYVSERSTSW